MLKVDIDTLNKIEQGVKARYKVVIHFQEPETYTKDDYLQRVGAINTGMSSEGSYEIANTTVKLRNLNYYFSEKFANELPVDKLIEIHMSIDSKDVLVFRGIVGSWSLTETTVTLNINA